RHLETGDDLILVGHEISLLVADDGAHDPDLEQGGEGLGDFRPDVAVGEREIYVRPVFVDAGDPQLEVSPREAANEFVREVDLGPTLVLGYIDTATRPPLHP